VSGVNSCVIKDLKIDAQKAQLVEAAKLSSLGEMAAGIAHEINNPLAIITGLAEVTEIMVKAKTFDAAEIVRSVEKIGKTSERIASIISGLRRIEAFCA